MVGASGAPAVTAPLPEDSACTPAVHRSERNGIFSAIRQPRYRDRTRAIRRVQRRVVDAIETVFVIRNGRPIICTGRERDGGLAVARRDRINGRCVWRSAGTQYTIGRSASTLRV